MKTLLVVLASLVGVLALVIAATLLLIRFADGPKGPIPGGALTSGTFEDASTANWSELLGSQPVTEVELQLENPVGSRTTGAFAYSGALYIPCDLGYVWRRLPKGLARYFLHTLWVFKTWHTNVLADGRVVVRIRGKKYRLNAVRITDEPLLARFRNHVSAAAGKAFPLLSVETRDEDIWFFRLDPRSG